MGDLNSKTVRFALAGLFAAGVTVHVFLALSAAPTVAVYNDEIIFKVLSQEFQNSGGFHFGTAYQVNVPPLYPMVLSAADCLSDPVTIHRVMLVLNVLLFFSAVFPTYFIGRRLLSRRDALLAAALLLLLPQTVFTSWIMSESLFFPLFAWTLWLLIRFPENGRVEHVALGLLIAACVLTRLSGFLALGLLLLVTYRHATRVDGRRSPWCYAGYSGISLVVAAVSVALMWLWLGYFKTGIHYQPSPGVPYNALRLGADFFRWTAINLAGFVLSFGMLLPLLAIVGATTPGNRKTADFQFLLTGTVVLLIVGAAWAVLQIRRATPDFWHPITRYVFYCAPLLLPAAIHGWRTLAEGRHTGCRPWTTTSGLFLLFLVTLWPIHTKLHNVRRWFADGPDLEWYRHIARGHDYPVGEIMAVLLLAALALLFVYLCRRFPRLAMGLVALVLLNLKIQAYDYQFQLQEKHRVRYAAPQEFAIALERGDYPELPVLTDSTDDMSRPMGLLYFWTRGKVILPGWAADWSQPHYYVTSEEADGERLLSDGTWSIYRVP